MAKHSGFVYPSLLVFGVWWISGEYVKFFGKTDQVYYFLRKRGRGGGNP